MSKLLSIIIPMYNASRTVGRTLESLRILSSASRSRCQVVIVDDGSQDGSGDVVEQKIPELVPLDILLLQQQNQGTGSARNAGLARSCGEWVLFLDADDELAMDPAVILQSEADATALQFSVRYLKNGRYRGARRPIALGSESHLDRFTAGNACIVSGIIFRRDCVQRPFDPSLRYLEDWQFWLSNPGIFRAVHNVPELCSSIVHIGSSNKTSNYRENGWYREIIATSLLHEQEDTLTRKQRNNLLLQQTIGRLLQGKNARLRTNLFPFPCDLALFGKLIAYSFFRGLFLKYGRYTVNP